MPPRERSEEPRDIRPAPASAVEHVLIAAQGEMRESPRRDRRVPAVHDTDHKFSDKPLRLCRVAEEFFKQSHIRSLLTVQS